MEAQNFNTSYIGTRDDIINLIPVNTEKVLDVGCSIGTVGEQIKQRNRDTKVTGIEIDKAMAEVAKGKLDRVIIGNIEEIDLAALFQPGKFDCVIFGDILEQIIDPWYLMKRITNYLSVDGVVIASIPNIRYYETILNLLFRGYWPYRERGIYDKTHLRFFTLKNIKELFTNSGLMIHDIKRKYRIIEKPHSINKFSKYFAFFPIRDLIAFQYLIVARKA
jgi:2-polyprenyl-3-methyl-5-hydroxy-6-metoxy-1,4-benzoquinol methylase